MIDRVVVKEGVAARLSDSLESALRLGDGKVIIDVIGEEELLLASIMLVQNVASPLENLSPACFHLIVRTGRVQRVTG